MMRKMRHPTAMEQVVDENPSTSQQPDNVNVEQVDYDRDTDNDDDLDDEEQPLAGNPMPKAMPHPKLVPRSPPTTLRLMSKMKPAPKNILDEETESDNHPGDRPALPRRPATRPTLTSRWHVPDGSDTDISLQRESVHPGPFGNSKFLNFVYEYYKECSTILETNPEFHFIPEHERQHGAKVLWLKARFNDYWKPTLQGEGPHTEKQYMDFIKRSTAFAAIPMLSQKFSEQTSFRWYVTTAISISRRPSRTLSRCANTSTWIHPKQNRSPTSSSGESSD